MRKRGIFTNVRLCLCSLSLLLIGSCSGIKPGLEGSPSGKNYRVIATLVNPEAESDLMQTLLAVSADPKLLDHFYGLNLNGQPTVVQVEIRLVDQVQLECLYRELSADRISISLLEL